MRFALSTAVARAGALSPGALVDVAQRAGATALSLDSSLPAGYVDELRRLLARRPDELPVWAVESVCPADKRASAELGSLDREEARVAVGAAADTIRLAAELGDGSGTIVLLRLGEVSSLRARWPVVRRAFVRAELEGSRLLASLLAERAALAARHLNPLRRSLNQLARVAESAGVRLGLRNPARAIGLPSPIELRVLLADLTGGPLAPALDVPAAHLAAAMGLLPLDETLGAWRSAPLVLLADACGPVAGLPWGRGEIDLEAIAATLDPAARIVFAAAPHLDEAELTAGALAIARAAIGPPSMAVPTS